MEDFCLAPYVSRQEDLLEGFSLRKVKLFSQTFIICLHFYICLTACKRCNIDVLVLRLD